jgi:hypothetical protein
MCDIFTVLAFSEIARVIGSHTWVMFLVFDSVDAGLPLRVVLSDSRDPRRLGLATMPLEECSLPPPLFLGTTTAVARFALTTVLSVSLLTAVSIGAVTTLNWFSGIG